MESVDIHIGVCIRSYTYRRRILVNCYKEFKINVPLRLKNDFELNSVYYTICKLENIGVFQKNAVIIIFVRY